jgi:hypothetical protein
VSDSVKVTRIKEIYAELKGVPKGGYAFVIVRFPSAVKIRHSHAAQPQSRHVRLSFSQFPIFQTLLLSFFGLTPVVMIALFEISVKQIS